MVTASKLAEAVAVYEEWYEREKEPVSPGTAVCAVRMPGLMKEVLAEMAEHEGLPVSVFVRKILKVYMDESLERQLAAVTVCETDGRPCHSTHHGGCRCHERRHAAAASALAEAERLRDRDGRIIVAQLAKIGDLISAEDSALRQLAEVRTIQLLEHQDLESARSLVAELDGQLATATAALAEMRRQRDAEWARADLFAGAVQSSDEGLELYEQTCRERDAATAALGEAERRESTARTCEQAALDSATRTLRQAETQVAEANRLLCDLTIGGSEFANNPRNCARWIRKEIDSSFDAAIAANVRRAKAEADLAAAAAALGEALAERDHAQEWAAAAEKECMELRVKLRAVTVCETDGRPCHTTHHGGCRCHERRHAATASALGEARKALEYIATRPEGQDRPGAINTRRAAWRMAQHAKAALAEPSGEDGGK